MRMKLRRWVVVAIGLTACGGCAGMRGPSVEVAGVRTTAISDEAAALQIDLDLTNRGKDELRLSEFDYRVNVDGQRGFEGPREALVTLAPGETRRVSIPAAVGLSTDETITAAPQHVPKARISVSGTLAYIPPSYIGRVLRDIGLLRPRAAFSDDVEVEIALHNARR